MENKVNQRVIKFLKFKNISKNRFCEMITVLSCPVIYLRIITLVKLLLLRLSLICSKNETI